MSARAPLAASAPVATGFPARLPIVVVFAVAVIGAVLGSIFQFVWHPPFTTDWYDYDTIAPMRETWYVMHFFVGGLGYLLGYTAFAVLVVLVCLRGRVAQPLALGGALLLVTGAALVAIGFGGEGAAWRWLTDPAVLDASAGAEALRGLQNVDLTTWVILLGILLVRVGAALAFVAALVSRRVPRWLPIVGLALIVVSLLPVFPPEFPLPERIVGFALVVAQLAVGWFALRPGRGSAATGR